MQENLIHTTPPLRLKKVKIVQWAPPSDAHDFCVIQNGFSYQPRYKSNLQKSER